MMVPLTAQMSSMLFSIHHPIFGGPIVLWDFSIIGALAQNPSKSFVFGRDRHVSPFWQFPWPGRFRCFPILHLSAVDVAIPAAPRGLVPAPFGWICGELKKLSFCWATFPHSECFFM